MQNSSKPSCVQTGKKYQRTCFGYKDISKDKATIHLLMLDMYKGFDTVDRAILLKDLKTVLDPDELHLIKIMFKTDLIVR